MATTPTPTGNVIVDAIDAGIVLAEQLFAWIASLKSSGQLTDAQEEAAITALNNSTRALIASNAAPPPTPAG